MLNKIFITEKFSTEAKALLLAQKHLQIVDDSHQAEGLLIRSRTKINSEFLNLHSHLKVIITSTSGYDHIDLIETAKRKITVMYTPDANSTAAAEHTWSLLLCLVRHVNTSDRSLRSGVWERNLYSGLELSGKTLGIIGFGRIGQKMAQIGRGFSMEISVFDPYQDDEVFHSFQTPRQSYEETLKSSDVISFHVPLTKETKNMFNQNHQDYVHAKTLVINASRGGVVNELDLVEMLEKKKILGAALDVFEKEPLPRDSKLLKAPRLLLTAHLGAITEEAFEKSSMEAAQLIINYFNSNAVRNTLPLKNNWGLLSFDS